MTPRDRVKFLIPVSPVLLALALALPLCNGIFAGRAAACDSKFIAKMFPEKFGHFDDGGPKSPHKGPFPSDGVALQSQLMVQDFPGAAGWATDIWGYVSPSGREYAIAGLNNGTAFVEVTDPNNPVILDVVPHPEACCSDAKVYQDYAYIVSEGDNSGLQVVDLSQIDTGVVDLVTTYRGANLGQAHNIHINETSGFAYVCGAYGGPASGGLLAIDLADPEDPQFAGAWDGKYVHDTQVVTYENGEYAGREFAFTFSGFVPARLRILDVTDKSDIKVTGVANYPNSTFSHQGWLSEDRKYIYLNDEFDETDHGVTTATHVIDVQDVSNPRFVRSFTSGRPSTDHNLTVEGPFVFESNYTSGLRVFYAPTPGLIHQVGYFDTFPSNDNPGFHGAWGIYAKLPSGNLLVTDIESGLFVLDASEAMAKAQAIPAASAVALATLAVMLLTFGAYTARWFRVRRRQAP